LPLGNRAQAGLRVPDDVGILGAGNDPLLCGGFEPTLSSVDLAWERVGYHAAELLDWILDGTARPTQPLLIAPPGIHCRRSTDTAPTTDLLVAGALRHIAEHCGEPLRIADVAAACGVPARSLQRRFTDHGRSVTHEILLARHHRACRLLAGDRPIAEVARQCGYATPTGFLRAFRAIEGLAPRAWREARRKAVDSGQ